MKKVFFSAFILAALFLTAGSANAQTPAIKIGVFDIDLMVQAMPGYPAVDSLVQIYNRDSLQKQYDDQLSIYNHIDSTLRADSLKQPPVAASIMNYNNDQKKQIGIQLAYWQQIAQNKSDQYRGQLAQPLYEQVAAAYKKVLDARKYVLVLKPNTFELGSQIENVFLYVAKELKVQLPQELGGGQAIPEDQPKTTPPVKH